MSDADQMSGLLVYAVAAALLTACSSAGDGNIERISPLFDRLVARDAKIEKIADGFGFAEGPVWVDAEGGYLLFSDIPGNRIIRWSENGGTTTFLEPILAADADTGARGGSNGLTRDRQGRLIIAEHGNRRIARLEEDMTRTTIADRYGGNRFSSPNDVVVHSDGSIYFTDPPYGLADGDVDPRKEMNWNGIYRRTRAGQVQLLTHQSRPNGLAFSPDEKTLYVNNSKEDERTVTAYAVSLRGTLDEGRVFFDGSDSDKEGVPDGIKVDNAGNVWTTGPGGILVFTSSGVHLGTISPDEEPSNLAFGDDGKTLYITAVSGLYRIRLLVDGPIP